jgi:hypothetical protein
MLRNGLKTFSLWLDPIDLLDKTCQYAYKSSKNDIANKYWQFLWTIIKEKNERRLSSIKEAIIHHYL